MINRRGFFRGLMGSAVVVATVPAVIKYSVPARTPKRSMASNYDDSKGISIRMISYYDPITGAYISRIWRGRAGSKQFQRGKVKATSADARSIAEQISPPPLSFSSED